jgi:metallo-beta-lactamase family protein
MRLTFWGAARQVTGSMFLLELEDGYKILIDCGMDMERARAGNVAAPTFPFDVPSVDVTILTHAHVDHSGNIPNLYRYGFQGQVLCTSPTLRLTELLLLDSAALNRKKINDLYAKKARRNKKKKAVLIKEAGEWYLQEQVEKAMDNFVDIPFYKDFPLHEGVTLTFIPSGHLLGAAYVVLKIKENGVEKSIAFSGDAGRYNYPLLVDPQPLPTVDYLVCETTYGNRLHTIREKPEEELGDIIRKACVDIPGRLIIPAFSVGRTQALLYTMNKLFVQGKLPPIKIFSDSPLAFESTQAYNRFPQYLNPEAREFMARHQQLFDFDNLIYVKSLRDSQALNNYREPCIIISSSGMISGGRVQHHVQKNLQNPYCTILMVGYSVEGTLGNQLLNLNGEKTLQLAGKKMTIKANILYTDLFSGHGDRNDLLRLIKSQKAERLKNLFLVHGEYSSMQEFEKNLQQEGFKNVSMPEKGQSYDL